MPSALQGSAFSEKAKALKFLSLLLVIIVLFFPVVPTQDYPDFFFDLSTGTT